MVLWQHDCQKSCSAAERQMLHDITSMWDLQNNTSESRYKTETDSQARKTNLRLPKGRRTGEGQIGSMKLIDTNYCT